MIPPGYTLISTAFKTEMEGRGYQEARGIFRYLLLTGQIDTYYTLNFLDQLQAFSLENWRQLSDAGMDYALAYGNYDLQCDYLAWPEDTEGYERLSARKEPVEILVERAELHSALAEYAQSQAKVQPKTNRGGRPPQYIDFMIEAVVLLQRAGLNGFKSPAELKKATQKIWSRIDGDEIENNKADMAITPLFNRWAKDIWNSPRVANPKPKGATSKQQK